MSAAVTRAIGWLIVVGMFIAGAMELASLFGVLP